MSFHRAYAPINGIRLHYAAAGAGQPMLFLHGHPDFWYLWKDQLVYFEQTHQVVAPDLRGYNLSDKPADVAQYRLPILVEDIRELIDHIGQTPVVLVAHDWGAVIAWEFAARYPAYLDELLVLSTPPLDVIRRALRDPEQRKQWYYMLMVISPQAEQILRAGDYALYTRTVFGPPTRVAPDYVYRHGSRSVSTSVGATGRNHRQCQPLPRRTPAGVFHRGGSPGVSRHLDTARLEHRRGALFRQPAPN